MKSLHSPINRLFREKEEPDFHVSYGSRRMGVCIDQLEDEGVRVSFDDSINPISMFIPVRLQEPEPGMAGAKYEYLSQLTKLQEETQKVSDFLFTFFTDKDTYLGLYSQVERQLREEKLWIFPDFSKEREAEKSRVAKALERERQLFRDKIAPILAAKGIETRILTEYLLSAMRSHPEDKTSFLKPRRRGGDSWIKTTYIG